MVYHANVTKHNTVQTALEHTYFMAVIDGVFCLDARVIFKRKTLSVVMFAWSKIMDRIQTL